ncbi:MAG: hypothetical protein AAF468_20925 [Pseudomonadota bacterium]
MQQSHYRQIYHYLALIFLAALALAPIWVMITTSFKNDIDVQSSTPLWFFFWPTLDNYEYIMTRGKFDRYLWNSIIIASASTVMTLLLGGFCAYALARLDFRGRTLMANSTLMVRMVPPAVLAVPAFAFVTLTGVDNDLAVLTFF